MSSRRVCGLALLLVLLGGTRCSMGLSRGGETPGVPAIVSQAASPAGPFLYVGGWKLSMYALGSTTPLHVTSVPYVSHAYVALDSHGNLCEANGNVTAPAINAFNARTLKLEGSRGGAGAGPVAADHSGYLYEASGGAYVLVYAPGCTHYVNAISNCVCGTLVFDQSGNLYAGGNGVRVYAPTQKPWHMKLMRVIDHGIDGPVALAIGPSGELYVANGGDSSVSVFAPGGSAPIRRITKGVDSPDALAVDSTGQLYVANQPESSAGWVAVYAPAGTQPTREIGNRPHFFPDSLAVDPSNDLYVGIRSAVNVYTPGGAKLLRRITNHSVWGTWALLIGSP
jgi:DNA-binding beta-propeller fold protein YncE